MVGAARGDRIWYRTRTGRLLVLGYLLLALVGMVLSVGNVAEIPPFTRFPVELLPGWVAKLLGPNAIDEPVVPFFVYFYGFLGSMGYIFVSFITNPDLDAQVVTEALRERGIETDRDLLRADSEELGQALDSDDLADELQRATAQLWASTPKLDRSPAGRRIGEVVETIDVFHLEKTTIEIWKIGFRVPAALLLVAGAHLLIFQPLGADIDILEPDTAQAGLAFLVGLYVKPAHEAVGRLADRLLAAFGAAERPGPIERAIELVPERAWYDDALGIGLVVGYLVVTLAAVLISVEGGVRGTPPDTILREAMIPAEVYFYGFLGAMAYVFTSLLNEFEKDVRHLVQMGLRIPAALLLAAGVFLLGAFFVDVTDADAMAQHIDTLARLAFLVGLYVKLTLTSLGTLADSLLSKVK